MDRYPTNLPIIEQTRAEVLSGPERRRRWTFEQKARVVAESLAPGAVASDVARRHGIHPNQLYGWRREVRAATAPTEFVAVTVAAEPMATASPLIRPDAVSGIELRIGDAELRIGRDVEPGAIMAAIRALKAPS
nr:transposase [Telmatospirillum siberiense]